MSKKILYTVLNWGLGHASRSIPIIQQFLDQKNTLVIASDGDALLLLKKEFPNQIFEVLPAYNIYYSKTKKNFDKTIFLQLKKLGRAIQEEYKTTEQLIAKHQITHIVSDNRYGCYSQNIPSTIVCHQLNLQHHSFISKKIMNQVHSKLLNQFNEIWVPDVEENALAGNISSARNVKIASKIKYIGVLSRFEKKVESQEYNLCIVLSGPEPQRSILEQILYNQVKKINTKTAFVRGVAAPKTKLENQENISVFNLLSSKELNLLINTSQWVVCRAGYSSIMDLAKIGKTALLIPTPGQTEQEYLANYLSKKGYFVSRSQEQVALKKDLPKLLDVKLKLPNLDSKTMEHCIRQFLTNFAP